MNQSAARARCSVEGAWLFEEMRGARHDRQPVLAAKLSLRFPVQLEHDGVVSADDQQRRRRHPREMWSGQIGPASTADDGSDRNGRIVGGNQRRRRAGARSEQSDRQVADGFVVVNPTRRRGETRGQQLDVEHVSAIVRFVVGQQVERERAQPCGVQPVCDVLISWAVPAAPAAVGEHHQPAGVRRNGQVTGEHELTDIDLDLGVDPSGRAAGIPVG